MWRVSGEPSRWIVSGLPSITPKCLRMLSTPRRPMRTPSTFTRPQPPSSVPSEMTPRRSTQEVKVAPSSTPQNTVLKGAPNAEAASIVFLRMSASGR